jgi:hypothetical protein
MKKLSMFFLLENWKKKTPSRFLWLVNIIVVICTLFLVQNTSEETADQGAKSLEPQSGKF